MSIWLWYEQLLSCPGYSAGMDLTNQKRNWKKPG
jgi:hypothetical protein